MALSKNVARAVVIAAAAGATITITAAAVNAAGKGVVAAPADLKTVINNLRSWLIGLLVALATLCLTIGGLRYLLAAGDPGEVNKAKETLKYAAIGYGIAALAPGLVEILKRIVGA
ncbi:pilin [Actinoallomurus sp. NPDC050550]|uniref:pilin n=1 Tax=Actinoallomurus sp. NPDC050550 TaxID=3154937 RepID=UPI0033E9EB65